MLVLDQCFPMGDTVSSLSTQNGLESLDIRLADVRFDFHQINSTLPSGSKLSRLNAWF